MNQSNNHNGSLFDTYRRLISLGVIPFFWGLLSLAPSKASADTIDAAATTTQATDDATTGNSVTLKSGVTSDNATTTTPDSDQFSLDSTNTPATNDRPANTPIDRASIETTTPSEKSTTSTKSPSATQTTSNVVVNRPVAKSSKEPISASQTDPQVTGDTITNATQTAPVTPLTDEQLNEVSTAVNESLQRFNDSNGSDYQLTGVTNIGKRAVATVTATNVTNPYAALVALNSAVINDDRLFYLKNIAGQQLQLYFNYNGSLVSSVLSIPVAIQAVTSDGTVLQQKTNILDSAGHALLPGGSWTTTAPTIPGYTLTSQPTNASGSWNEDFDYTQLTADNHLLVTYRYQVTPQYVQVVFVDDSDDQVVHTVTLTGVLGQTTSYDPTEVAKSLDGNYQLVSSDIPSDGITYNSDGTIISYRVHLTPIKSTTDLDNKPDFSDSTPSDVTGKPSIDSTILPDATVFPDIITKPEKSQSVSTPSDVPIPDALIDSSVLSSPGQPVMAENALISDAQPDTLIVTTLSSLSVPVLALQDPFTLVGHVIGSVIDEFTMTHASAEITPDTETNTTPSLKDQPSASANYFTNTDESVTLSDNTVHFAGQHHRRNRTDASGDSILQLFPHPDMIKEPGGGATRTQLGKYLSSIGGTINFGTTVAESETIPLSEL